MPENEDSPVIAGNSWQLLEIDGGYSLALRTSKGSILIDLYSEFTGDEIAEILKVSFASLYGPQVRAVQRKLLE